MGGGVGGVLGCFFFGVGGVCFLGNRIKAKSPPRGIIFIWGSVKGGERGCKKYDKEKTSAL